VLAIGLLLSAELALAQAAPPAGAQAEAAPKAAGNTRREKMAACKVQADEKELAGTERKRFMKSCAQGGPKTSAHGRNYAKMNACKKEADEKNLPEAERKQFMSKCRTTR
jgi:hypothetical protein